jgi:hypothetical protein
MQPLPVEERDAIRDDIQKNFSDVLLRDDPNNWRVPGQSVFLFSCLSPWSTVENAEMKDVHEMLTKMRISKINQRKLIREMYDKMRVFIKVRGCFPSEKDANDFLHQNIGYGDGIQSYIAKMYAYGPVPPNKYAKKEEMTVNYNDPNAQKYYNEQRRRIEEETRTFDRRRQIFKKAASDNCRRWEKLSDAEKQKKIDEDDRAKNYVEGVHVDKVMKHATIIKLIDTEILNAINSIAAEAQLPVELLVGAWSTLKNPPPPAADCSSSSSSS